MSREPARICRRCVLPEGFPGVTLGEDGLCPYCRDFRGLQVLEEEQAAYRERFEDLLRSVSGRGSHDCLVCYSGGKDSSYTLDLLKRHHGLRVVAVTMDNGFISPVALRNIQRVVEALDVDHIAFKPRFGLLQELYTASANEDLHPRKSLERASGICMSCIGLVKFIALRIAIEKGIPLIAFGWSPGQAPLRAAILRTNPQFLEAAQRPLLDLLRRRFGEEVRAYFLEEEHLHDPDRCPSYVHPLAFHQYDEERIHARLAELGWERPGDTDPNSTNCLLNAYANHVHQERFGYNPYVFEIASLVRRGILPREEGLRRLAWEMPGTDREAVLRRLQP